MSHAGDLTISVLYHCITRDWDLNCKALCELIADFISFDSLHRHPNTSATISSSSTYVRRKTRRWNKKIKFILHAEVVLHSRYSFLLRASFKISKAQFPFIFLVGSAMPFLPTKVQDHKFDNQGTKQGLFTMYKLQVLNDTFCQISRSHSDVIMEHVLL